jgi:thiazole biosynthesis enzyme
MALDEKIITEAILTNYFEKFKDCIDVDVAIVGAGPSGLIAAERLASQDFKVAIFEQNLSVGGGMWGGGMTFNFIVIQEESKYILEEMGLTPKLYRNGHYTVDAVAATATIASKACLAGAKIFNCVCMQDVVIREENGQKRVCGLVINSSPVDKLQWHVDPIMIHSKFVIEASGHPTEVLKVLTRKNDIKLMTPSGGLEGEQSMWVDMAEKTTVENSKEIFPGVYVTGMAANAAFGSYRMGPIFGSMLLSGVKVAEDIAERLRG